MAITTRFFSTSGAGAADGTTWADRAALFSAGNWSSVITGFSFGTDSLKCLIGPGSYTCSQVLNATTITTDPTAAGPLFLIGCDSSGVMLSIPDPDWMSCQPAWDSSTLPVIATSTNIATITCPNVLAYMLSFTASGRNGAVVTDVALSWCQVTNSTANTSANAVAMTTVQDKIYGCVLKCSGSSYSAVVALNVNNTELTNTRVEGVAGSSGNRQGINITSSANNGILTLSTIVNCGGAGLLNSSVGTGQTWRVYRCTIANNASDGLQSNSTASQTDYYRVEQCMITGNGGFGINPNSDAGRFLIEGNRLRDNTSGNYGSAGNYPTDLNNYTTDSDDATEYVSTGANGDFQIKNTAAIWGQGYGAGEQAPPTGPAGQQCGMS